MPAGLKLEFTRFPANSVEIMTPWELGSEVTDAHTLSHQKNKINLLGLASPASAGAVRATWTIKFVELLGQDAHNCVRGTHFAGNASSFVRFS
jgi:hypothetical protein